MTDDKTLFSSIFLKKQGFVSYGDNYKGKNLDFGIVSKSPSPTIEEVLLVKGLKHTLLSISQLCDKGNNITFDSYCYMVIKSKLNKKIVCKLKKC